MESSNQKSLLVKLKKYPDPLAIDIFILLLYIIQVQF